MKKLKTKWLAWSMALVMILGIVQVGAMPIVQAADENTEVEYEQIPQNAIQNPTASSHANHPEWGDGDAALAFDGNTDSAWHTDYNEKTGPHTIEWGIGEAQVIGKVAYRAKDTGANGRFKDFTVSVKNGEGAGWTQVKTESITDVGKGGTYEVVFTPVEATHVQITITGSYNDSDTGVLASAGELYTYKAIPVTPEPPAIENPIKVIPETLTLKEGEEFTLEYELTPEAIEAGWVGSWDSANTNSGVVKFDVNTGKGVAVGAGDITIQAKATLKTETGSTSKYVGCKIHVDKAETESVIVLNGTEYTASGLEDAIGQFGLTASGVPQEDITSIEFKSGIVRDEDLDYLYANKKWFDYELKSFKIADDVAVMGLSGNEIAGQTFQLNGSSPTELQHVYLGKNVKGLAKNAFKTCRNLITIEAPGLEYLKENSLGNVNKVAEFNFPSLKTIAEDAFGTYSNSVTTKISLPAVETLEHDTFKNFTALEELTLGAVPPQTRISSRNLEFAAGVAENLKLNIPDGALAAYQADKGYDAAAGTWYGIPLAGNAHQHEEMLFTTAIKEPVTALTEGSYYLDADITAAKQINVSGDVKLCLNGHSYAVGSINVPEGASLTICDCGESGTIVSSLMNMMKITGGTVNLESGKIITTSTGSSSSDGAINIKTGTLNVKGGTIEAGTKIAIYAYMNSGSGTAYVNVSGGNIKHNKSYKDDSDFKNRGSIKISNDTTLNITGGTVEGVFVDKGSTVTNISGGTIDGCLCITGGTTTVSNQAVIQNDKDWAIDVRGGITNITGGTITGQINGICIGESGSELNISGGTIKGIEESGLHVFNVRYPNYNCTPNMVISGGTITGKTYGIDLEKFNPTDRYYMLSLTGTPVISGETADILMTKEKQIYGHLDGNPYNGKPLTIAAKGEYYTEKEGAVVVVVKAPVDPASLLGKFVYQTESDLELAAGKEALVLKKHEHAYTYAANGNVITESCTCGHSATATITAKDAEYTGEAIETATVAYTENWAGEKPDIVYENNTEVGNATAKITVGEAIASVTFTITDTTAPKVTAVEVLNDDNTVTVTLTADEPLQTPEGWTAGEDSKTFTKVYTANGSEKVTVSDLAGNKAEVEVKVTLIDETAPEVTVDQKYNEKDNTVTVTLTANEQVKTPEGWTAGEDGKTFTKVYTANGSEKVTVSDLAGNKAEVEVNVTLIDETAPEVTVDQKYNEKDNTVTVTLTANEQVKTPEGWTAGEDSKTFTKVYTANGSEKVTVSDLAGNKAEVEVKVTLIDETAPEVTVDQKYNEKDNTVTVTLTANEQVKTPEGWTAGEDGKTFTKVYTANGSEKVTVSDLAGNKAEVEINVTLIDETAPEVTVDQKYNEKDNTVTVTLTANEQVKTPEGWTAGEDGKTFTKVYAANESEKVTVSDLAGNKAEVEVNVTLIDETAPEVKVEQKYDKKDNTVTVTITTNESVKAPEGWKQADKDGKVFTRVYDKNGKYTVVVEDKFGNETKVAFEVKDIVKKDDGKPGESNKPDDGKKPDNGKQPTTPKSGDHTPIAGWGILIISAMAAIGIVLFRRKKN